MVHSFLGAFALLSIAEANCLGNRDQLVFQDPHDGDMKLISNLGMRFAIQPYPNTDDWKVLGEFDYNCQAPVDFNVPGKPNPPPVNLTMTVWIMGSTDDTLTRIGLEFTDPSSTLAPATDPVNLWVLDHWPKPIQASDTFGPRGIKPSDISVGGQHCIYTPRFNSLIVSDMHDGDKKSLKASRDSLTVKPYDNGESWTVKAQFDSDCVASVDFNVAGKPNPPPVPLDARVWGMASVSLDDDVPDKKALLFSDPSETLGQGILNVWVQGNEGVSQSV